MKELATLLNAMREAGVILDCALFGATARMRYTEPVATFDADVLVTVPAPERLDVLNPSEPPLRVLRPAGLASRRRGDSGGKLAGALHPGV